MTQIPPQCQNLPDHVDCLLKLLSKEPSLKGQHNTTAINTSLKKAIDPRFEIIFAGTFSAGKSMLINALLGQELLFSDIGHATGTECYIEYAEEPQQERVVLTFLSASEIQEEANDLCQELELKAINITQAAAIERLCQNCEQIIKVEGGPKSTELAKSANGLKLLLKGFEDNRKHIRQDENATYRMEQLGLSFKDAANYARRGSNSAVLKRIEYYCHHPLLEDGNVLVDLPGIDAPVQRDAELTYRKVEDTETSAVVCVLKADLEGETRQEEDKLTKKMRDNTGIRDRVFYVFNRIDKTWRDSKLKQKLDGLITTDFSETSRGVYLTSGLLGFFGSQIKNTGESERWGLQSIFAESVKGSDGGEGTPSFVLAFNDYCFSGKLPPGKFRILRDNAETENETYVRILNQYKTELISQLIQDSGIEEFRDAITRYLTEKKRPELFANLADDLRHLCFSLYDHYLETRRYLNSQPRDNEAMKERDLERLNQELQEIAATFHQHIKDEVNEVVVDNCQAFKADFRKLQAKMEGSLKELLNKFSVLEAYKRTTRSHQRNGTAPLVAILGEAFYYLANELEDVLVKEAQTLVASFFHRLIERVRKAEYYRKLCDSLGNDAGIVQTLKAVEKRVSDGIEDLARAECEHYVLESSALYAEGNVWIYQFRETLQQASQSLDVTRMKEAEPAIRNLLEIDFQPSVENRFLATLRPKIIKTLQSHLLSMAKQQHTEISLLYDHARAYLEETIGKKTEEKIEHNRQAKDKVERKIEAYNQAVASINSCLEAIGLDDKLPVITEADSSMTPTVNNTNIAALAAGRTIKQKTLRNQGFAQQPLKKK